MWYEMLHNNMADWRHMKPYLGLLVDSSGEIQLFFKELDLQISRKGSVITVLV